MTRTLPSILCNAHARSTAATAPTRAKRAICDKQGHAQVPPAARPSAAPAHGERASPFAAAVARISVACGPKLALSQTAEKPIWGLSMAFAFFLFLSFYERGAEPQFGLESFCAAVLNGADFRFCFFLSEVHLAD